MTIDTSLEFVSINIAVLTISDTRTPKTDTSGALLQERINAAGHHCLEKTIIFCFSIGRGGILFSVGIVWFRKWIILMRKV